MICCILVFSYNFGRWFSSSYFLPIGMGLMFFFSTYYIFNLINFHKGLVLNTFLDSPFDSFERTLLFSLYFIPQLCLAPIPSSENKLISFLAVFIHFCYIVYKDSQPLYSKSTKMALFPSESNFYKKHSQKFIYSSAKSIEFVLSSTRNPKSLSSSRKPILCEDDPWWQGLS